MKIDREDLLSKVQEIQDLTAGWLDLPEVEESLEDLRCSIEAISDELCET